LLALLALACLVLGILYAVGVLGNKSADYTTGVMPVTTTPISTTTTTSNPNTAYMFPPTTAYHNLASNTLRHQLLSTGSQAALSSFSSQTLASPTVADLAKLTTLRTIDSGLSPSLLTTSLISPTLGTSALAFSSSLLRTHENLPSTSVSH
jgi:hypothetical protein